MNKSESEKLTQVIFDVKLAQQRIDESGRYYKISELSDLVLDDKDFESARNMEQQEANVVLGNNGELVENGLFQGIVYALLSSRQQYSGQIGAFNTLLKKGLSADEILKHKTGIANILGEHNVLHSNQKTEYIVECAQNWDNIKNTFLDIISSEIKTTRCQEVQLRDSISQKVKGLGPKTTSIFLRMCGAKYLVPVDSSMGEMLYFYGYPFNMPRTIVKRVAWQTTNTPTSKLKKSGLNGKRYLQAEELAFDLAKRYGTDPHILQLAIWTKNSTYAKEE